MSMDLPSPIAAYIEANARLDLDGMLKPFQLDAVVIDNGKRSKGGQPFGSFSKKK